MGISFFNDNYCTYQNTDLRPGETEFRVEYVAAVSVGRNRYRGENISGNDIFLPCAELYSTGAGSKCCSTIFAFKENLEQMFGQLLSDKEEF